MPTAALRPCAKPGCPALTDAAFCPPHARERRQRIDATRPTARERGYGTRWEKYRRGYLSRHPLCALECGRAGRVTAATVVDHIRPHKGDHKLFWDPANHQPACKRCHDRKTACDDGGWGHPMASGPYTP